MPFLPESFTAAHVANPANDAASTWAPIKDRPEGNVECDGCRGDGVWRGAGRVENGVFIGSQGKCFRCGGKGSQTPADLKRNAYYDNRVRRYHVG